MTAAPPEVASLVIAEVYTNVWQGEGPSAGRLCSFIRLGGCNLTCGWARTQRGLERVPGAWACDEPHTWHSAWDLRTTLHRADAESVIARLTAPGTPELVVITGGEPLIHQDQPAWGILLRSLLEAGRVIEIETNGTITPVMGHRRIRHNVSPKLACSGLPLQDRYEPGVLEWHAGHASIFKFVVTGPGQVAEAACGSLRRRRAGPGVDHARGHHLRPGPGRRPAGRRRDRLGRVQPDAAPAGPALRRGG